MNTKSIALIIIAIIIALGGYIFWQTNNNVDDQQVQNEVKNVVEIFGKSLKAVSLLAPKEILSQSITENYQNLLTSELLNEWVSNPSKALGRVTSSPWPERIDIKAIEKISPNEYKVTGEIIELTSVEVTQGSGVAAKQNIELSVKKTDQGWRISAVSVTPYDETVSWQTIGPDKTEIFTFKYPQDYKLETGTNISGELLDMPILRITMPDNIFKNNKTNFVESYLTLSKSVKLGNYCQSFKDLPNPGNAKVGNKIINGINFSTRDNVGAAAGNTYRSHLYRTLINKTCYEFALTVHTGNIGNYPVGSVTEFDQSKAFNLLEKILNTVSSGQNYSGKLTGYIKRVLLSENGTSLKIDDVEFLSGEEAIAKGIQDTGCSRAKIYDCIPSLNNDFYIRNIDKSTKDYSIAQNTKIKIRESTGSPDQTAVNLDQFIKAYNEKDKMMDRFPFEFQIENGIITSAEEQYIP